MVFHNRHNPNVQCDLMCLVTDDLQKKTFNWVINQMTEMLDSGVDPRDCDFDAMFEIMKDEIDNDA